MLGFTNLCGEGAGRGAGERFSPGELGVQHESLVGGELRSVGSTACVVSRYVTAEDGAQLLNTCSCAPCARRHGYARVHASVKHTFTVPCIAGHGMWALFYM